MTKEEILANKLFPWLIIGDAVTDFKSRFDGRINYVSNLDEMRDLISYYSEVSYLERPLVIEDISLFAKNGEGTLLKFVEESKLNLILLSRFDKVSSVLLSRVRRIDKYYKDKVTSQFMKASNGLMAYSQSVDENTHYYDKIKKMGIYSPRLLLYERKIENKRLKERVLSFID